MHLFIFIIGWLSSSLAQTDFPVPAPSKLAIETAMVQAGLPTENASLLTGETTWRSDPSGVIHRHGSIEWRTLDGQDVIPRATDEQPTRKRYCHTAPGHDPVPGNREIHFVNGADTEAPPTLVLGTTPSHEVLLVDLQPGETISVLSVTHIHSGKTKERISLDRKGEMLVLRRHGDGAQACFTYPS